MHDSSHNAYPDEEDERGCCAAHHQQGSPPGTRRHKPSGTPRPGRLGYLRRGSGQAPDPAGNQFPPARLELAVLAASEVHPGPVADWLAGGLGDQVPEVQMEERVSVASAFIGSGPSR